MIGLSSSGKEAINAKVEEIFDKIALQFIGNIPRLKHKKLLILNTKPNYGLANLFVEAMSNKSPNVIEQDVLKSLLESSYGYIESLKSKTRSNVTERVDSAIKEAKSSGTKVTAEQLQDVISDEMDRAKSHMKLIAESESTKVRNVGSAMDISRVAATNGDFDPTVFFVVVRDGVTCNECKRLHLNDDGTPRVWKFSELKQGYHKRSDNVPSAFGLHPHCFSEDTLLHTSKGLKTLKDLFESQEELEVYADKRIKNRRVGNNQFGDIIPGEVWLDRHASGSSLKKAIPVFDTGIQKCYKVTLSNGSSLTVSGGHEMWVDDDLNGKRVMAENLQIGDKIPLMSGECGYGTDHFPELAELMGDGAFDDTAQRRIPARIFGADKQTVCAFLRRLYASDGHSEPNPSVALAQNDKIFLQEIQIILSNMGIISSILKYEEECFRLCIEGWDQVATFAKEIGMGVPSKQDKLLNFLQKTEGKTKHGSWRTATVESVQFVGELQTYCTNEPESNTVTANGIVTGNCRCTLTYLSSGFGFDKSGRVTYIGKDHDEHSNQRS